MGCDIHGIVEVHLDGSWQMAMDIGQLDSRNYAIFALLFGVRGQSSYEYKYRGLPGDRSFYTSSRFCRECNGRGHDQASTEDKASFQKWHPDEQSCGECTDWHSASWITIQEIEKHWPEVERTLRGDGWRETGWYLIFDSMRFWESRLREENVIVEATPILATGREDTSRVRLVVWFDN